MKIQIFAVVFAIVIGVIVGGVLMYYLSNSDCNARSISTQLQQLLSDTEYMRVGINNYLMSGFHNPSFPKPNYDVVLEDIAFDNAVNGKDLWISISGNTAEEALKTYIAVDQSVYTCGQASFWLDTNGKDYPNTKYAIGIYKTLYNQYNVSIVIKRNNPDTQEMNRNGAYVTVQHEPSIINYTTFCYRRLI